MSSKRRNLMLSGIHKEYNHLQADGMRSFTTKAAGDARRVCLHFPISVRYNIASSLRPLVHPCMRRPGCFPGAWTSWRLQVTSEHVIIDLCPLHLSLCFPPGARSGRTAPTERSSFYSMHTLRRVHVVQLKVATRRIFQWICMSSELAWP